MALCHRDSEPFAKRVAFCHSHSEPFRTRLAFRECVSEPFGELFEKLQAVSERFARRGAFCHSDSEPFETEEAFCHSAREPFSELLEKLQGASERFDETPASSASVPHPGKDLVRRFFVQRFALPRRPGRERETQQDRRRNLGLGDDHGAGLIPAAVWLPWTPGKGAAKRLARILQDKWGWRRVRGAAGEVVLETHQPSFARIVLPDPRAHDEERFRSVVAEVARHHGVTADEILASMLVEIEKEVKARKVKWERERKEAAARMESRNDSGTPWT